MKTFSVAVLTLFSLFLAFALSGCGGEEDAPPTVVEDPAVAPMDPATTSVVAHYRDSSVPPEYHRSWTLTLDQGEAHVVVDSYGDKVAEETVPMPQDLWEEFVASLPEELDELDEPQSVEAGCTGGTGMTLDVDGDPGTHLDLDNCNTPDNQAITDEIMALLEPFTDLVHLDRHTR